MRGIAIVGVHGGMCGHARSAKRKKKKEIYKLISNCCCRWGDVCVLLLRLQLQLLLMMLLAVIGVCVCVCRR